MPFHRIYAAPGLYSAKDKADIAASLTSYYTSFGLPAFYVVVIFHDVDPAADFYIGGVSQAERERKTGKPFVRVVSQHLALTMVGDRRPRGTDSLCAKFDPWIKDRGYEWELHIEEPSRDLWRINGLEPPPFSSEAEAVWRLQDAGVPC
ncbi:hypothetical protein FA09DRAFT_340672 [Tilletiopsis washingtonensis]|uniref:Tautomerase cis-CaaD-like domain-containing protein n=1 Tax=Tilletiopsis washingtonensis TaxID=58919 RepID=A0A316Z411_9BASI|nr:hypothetical protein FA09DRAFT_340672 [Tilletiopsis washingtonensis]PWN96116.1 hypothetical protein FA09DRAFT_340672 [Tilletiopsis washingtonensis]